MSNSMATDHEVRGDDPGFLRLAAISKRFGATQAVRSVDLAIREGEFVTLLGPSGCGKTTLLRIIGGFEPPSEGSVTLRGADLTAVAPERRPFNIVFQSYALFPHMSVADNVGYGPRMAGGRGNDVAGRVNSVLELVHLDGLGGRSVRELSGGQQQRVALARALVNEPDVLLLDEPLGALDLQLRKRLQDELRSIQQRLGTTFVYVTHDQEEALSLSHRIAVMEAGRLVQVSDPRTVYEHPATRFVAEFVGDTNLIECTVTQDRGDRVEVSFANGHPCELNHHGTRHLAAGEHALAVLRPQHLELAEPAGSPFVGVVRQDVFVGTHSRLEVVLDDGTAVRLNRDPDFAVPNGKPTGVRIKAGHGAVVPRDAEGHGAGHAPPATT